MTNKNNNDVELQAKEDRITALPDCLIQHILSLLPSTREAIQTSLLSQRWKNQWTHVPVLIFHSSGMSTEKFSRSIDDTLLLHRCSKIQKFHIQSDDNRNVEDPNWFEKIHFAIGKHVEELILNFSLFCEGPKLSKFLYNNASLIKLYLSSCNFDSMPNGRVSWVNLKVLKIRHSKLPDQLIENILGGSPSLESMEITCLNNECADCIIASKSLKRLVLIYGYIHVLQISCPNLEEFILLGLFAAKNGIKLMYLPSLICATLGFILDNSYGEYDEIEIIRHLQHVNELIFGTRFIHGLSKFSLGVVPTLEASLLSNNKYLTLYSPNFEKHYLGIALALRTSHVLEKLVINIQVEEHKIQRTAVLPGLNVACENYWNSIETVFNCLVSHLKIVEINGLSDSDDDKYKLVLNFIEFLLKNARVLEKLAVILKDGGKDFVIEVSQKLENFQKRSQNATLELLCRN